MSVENISISTIDQPLVSSAQADESQEQGELRGRHVCNIEGVGSNNPNVIVVKESAEKTSSLVGSIFKTFGVITLTGGIMGCFTLNPIAGLLLGAGASVVLSPLVIALHIANRVIS